MKRPPLRLFDFMMSAVEKKPWAKDIRPVPFALSENAVRWAIQVFGETKLHAILDAITTPFEHTWFEYRFAESDFACYVWANPDSPDIFAMTCFKKQGPGPFDWGMGQFIFDKNDPFLYEVKDGVATKIDRNVGYTFHASFSLMLLAFLSFPTEYEREVVDMSKFNRSSEKKARPSRSTYTYIKLTPGGEKWINHVRSGAKTVRDQQGRHWVMRHPFLCWIGKLNSTDRKTVIRHRGPYLKGNPTQEPREPEYRIT